MPCSTYSRGGTVQVGAATETELEDRKLRIEDAKNATFAAIEEGIVPGGGATMVHLSALVTDFKSTLTSPEEIIGANIVQQVSDTYSVHVHNRCLAAKCLWYWHSHGGA